MATQMKQITPPQPSAVPPIRMSNRLRSFASSTVPLDRGLDAYPLSEFPPDSGRARPLSRAAETRFGSQVAPVEDFDETEWMVSSRPGDLTHSPDSRRSAAAHRDTEELSEEDARWARRRRWPAIVAFAVVGSFVSLIGIGGAMHVMRSGGVSVNLVERVFGPSQDSSLVTQPPAPTETDSRVSSAGEQREPHQRAAAAVANLRQSQEMVSALEPSRGSSMAAQTPATSESVAQVPAAQKQRAPEQRAAAAVANLREPRTMETAPLPRKVKRVTRTRPAEPEQGIKVSDVYINDQGELVDARGKPLSSQ